MSISSIEEDVVIVEDPKKSKEILESLNSPESAFESVQPKIAVDEEEAIKRINKFFEDSEVDF